MDPPERRMFMYSGHDTTLSSLLNCLGVFDPPIPPPYASLVALELRQKGDDSYYVELTYRNDSTREPLLLTLPGCDTPSCPLSRFDEITRHLRPEDWRAECGLQADDATARAITVASAAVGVALLLVLMCSVVLHCVRRGRATTEAGYSSLSQDVA